MNELFTARARAALRIAQDEAKRFRHRSVGSEHLLFALISESNGLAGKMLRLAGANEDDIREEIETLTGYGKIRKYSKGSSLPYSPRTKQVLEVANDEAQHLDSDLIGTEHLLLGLLKDQDILAVRILINIGVNLSKLRILLLDRIDRGMADDNEEGDIFSPPFLGILNSPIHSKSSRKRHDSSFLSGTPTLNSIARDLTAIARKKGLDPVVGRDLEIRRVLQILSRRTKNNPVLVGDPGVGKTAIAEGLAQMIVSGDVPESIFDKRLMILDMGSVVAGTKYRGEFEERLKKIVDEIYHDGNIILFIDELHTLIGAGGAEGAIDASNILKPALARGELQTIGATTLDEYQKYIERDSALERRFARVLVDEPSEEETVAILQGLRSSYEKYHKVNIADEALQAAVLLSIRYINSRQLPDKAIDIIDEAAAKVRLENLPSSKRLLNLREDIEKCKKLKEDAISDGKFVLVSKYRKKEKKAIMDLQKMEDREHSQDYRKLYVLEKDVAAVVSEWTGVPLNQLTKKESDKLLHLEKILRKRVVGQEKAVAVICRAIRRARSGFKDPMRPIGSFMFLGPTGVGKTELAKALAEVIFGSEEAMIRVDMSEFMEKYSTSRLIGAPPGYVGYDEGGQLTEQVRKMPYSVILLDEVEKAHFDVFNLLLQVFDEGYLTDAKGRKVDFRNTIVIMTSNIGATTLREEKLVGFNINDASQDYSHMEKTILDELKETFRPEFLNRIDENVVFSSLEKDEINEIVKIMNKRIIKRLKVQGVKLRITSTAIEVIGKVGFDPEYGARPIRRALQREVEDRLSEALLSGQFAFGDQVTIGVKRGKIVLSIKKVEKLTEELSNSNDDVGLIKV
ncbi:MAG: ATP-dependent Clp protease ATP-binding subunit [Streptococcaceae bacterium]|jgi:ATP-dependent Clp protease ATP-binding subunit ClpC|nr:ATP-dependent Clp protease ATP-binding subunit [Streptococcaceae bacterium]